MDYSSLLSGMGGGGGGYSGEIKSDLKSGASGASTSTFGTVNFGAGSKVGGTTSDAGTGNNTLLYVALAVIGLVAMFLFMRR